MIQGQSTISSSLLARVQSLTSVCNQLRRAEIQSIHLFSNMSGAFFLESNSAFLSPRDPSHIFFHLYTDGKIEHIFCNLKTLIMSMSIQNPRAQKRLIASRSKCSVFLHTPNTCCMPKQQAPLQQYNT